MGKGSVLAISRVPDTTRETSQLASRKFLMGEFIRHLRLLATRVAHRAERASLTEVQHGLRTLASLVVQASFCIAIHPLLMIAEEDPAHDFGAFDNHRFADYEESAKVSHRAARR